MERLTVSRSPIYEKSLSKPRGEVSLSAFAFLLSEIVQYHQNRGNFNDIEKKLSESGYDIGIKIIELIGNREKTTRRETRIVNMLQYITNTIWRHLFNKTANSLERSTENEDEYMIHENSPITNYFSGGKPINLSAFIAGIIAGVLDSARFTATVTAFLVNLADGNEGTVFLIKFSPEVIARDRKLG